MRPGGDFAEPWVEWDSRCEFAHFLDPLPAAVHFALWEIRERAADGFKPTKGGPSRVGVKNACLRQIEKNIGLLPIHLVWDPVGLDAYAKFCAASCSRKTVAQVEIFAAQRGVLLTPLFLQQRGILWRVRSARWWRRRLRSVLAELMENNLRVGGAIHKGAAPYCSDGALQLHRSKKRATAKFLSESALVEKETGEVINLAEVAKGSLANPTVRRAELMVRLKGFEEIAREAGHCALFITVTTPSAYHAISSSGKKNPRFANFTPSESQEWQQTQWSRLRSALDRRRILYYGFRIAEPHHDATPHWHLVVFIPKHQASTFIQLFRKQWLSEYADEPGAEEFRFHVKEIDMERVGKDGRRGGAIGYVAKYVSKNVDGFALATDDPAETSLSGADAAERVEASVRTHRIRQFQQLGGPPVGLWREFRRLRHALDEPEMEAIRAAADAGDFAAFIRLLGGIENCRRSRARIATDRDNDLGDFLQRDRIREEEDMPLLLPRVIGIWWERDGSRSFVRTRHSEWIRAWIGSFSPPWTRGNNCTNVMETADGSAAAQVSGPAPNIKMHLRKLLTEASGPLQH